ncbi:MAG: Gfo/Idh/MocA family oxidoreductase [candidate division WS1 bacterium]|nr:Gfo/Idh/MocA family oxidoreductase [candidate division WS1 bacterium]
MTEPRAVVIGYGFAGRSFHSYLIGITPGLRLQGIASRNPETREKIVAERGCQAYESFEQVLEDPEVDLVVLATPNALHTDQAVQALEAGKNVVTDKVMALTLADCDRMIAAAEKSGKLLTVFQNRRWDGDYLTVRQLMAEGKLGEVRSVEVAGQRFGAWRGIDGWRGRKAMGGGKLYDLGAHLVDQLCLIFPQPIERVYAKLNHDLPETDTESQALVVIEFADGGTGIVDTSSLAAIRKPRWYVCGTGGTFLKHGLDPQEAAMIAGDIDAAREDPALYGCLHDGKTEAAVPTLAGRWRSYYENIRDVLVQGAEPAVKLSEVRRAIAVIDAAFRSAETKEVVSLEEPAGN